MYAQKDYLQIQGINGKYRIDQIGCFLDSFCNLQEDFNYIVNPIDLNNWFVEHSTYIDIDDGIRDDLDWGSITNLDPLTRVIRVADNGKNRTAGWPSTNHAIVRFYYQSVQHPTKADGSPNMIFHFCKVADAAAHTIIDSWDKLVKPSPYGEPTAWAEYTHDTPVAVAPPPAAVVPTDPDVTLVTVQPNWGITSVLGAAGYPEASQGNEAEWDRVAALNGSAARLHLTAGQIVKVNKTPLPIASPDSPTPVTVTINDSTAPVASVEVPAPPIDTTIAAADWKKTYTNIADYRYMGDSYTVKNLDTNEPYSDLFHGFTFTSVDRFTKDGVDYVRTAKMAEKDIYCDIELGSLKLLKATKIEEPDADTIFTGLENELKIVGPDLSHFADDLEKRSKKINPATFREKIVDAVGTVILAFTKKKK